MRRDSVTNFLDGEGRGLEVALKLLLFCGFGIAIDEASWFRVGNGHGLLAREREGERERERGEIIAEEGRRSILRILRGERGGVVGLSISINDSMISMRETKINVYKKIKKREKR